jgi:cold shock CspA family protein
MATVWTGLHDLPPVGGSPLVGEVAEFDDDRGLGVVEYGPGRRLPFHCTAITDGSRQIGAGTVVAFVVSAGRLGRLEARSVHPLPGVVRPGSTLSTGQARLDVGELGNDELDHGELAQGEMGEGERSREERVPTTADQEPALPRSVDPVPTTVMVGAPLPAQTSFVPGSRWSDTVDVDSVAPDVGASGSVEPDAVGSGVIGSEADDSGASEGPPDLVDPTPPFGTPAAVSLPAGGLSFRPVVVPPVAVPSEPVGDVASEPAVDTPSESPSDAPATASSGPSAPDDSPRPDFWSPIVRPTSGPPPTWRTPVTPKSPPSSDGE